MNMNLFGVGMESDYIKDLIISFFNMKLFFFFICHFSVFIYLNYITVIDKPTIDSSIVPGWSGRLQ